MAGAARSQVFVCGRGNDGAEDDNCPDQVHPDQKYRQGGEGAVQCFISGVAQNQQAENFADNPKQADGRGSAESRMADADLTVGDQHIYHNQDNKVQQTRQSIGNGRVRGLRHKVLQRIDIATER